MFRIKEKEKQGMRFEYELEDKTIIISIAYLTDKELSKVTGKSSKERSTGRCKIQKEPGKIRITGY